MTVVALIIVIVDITTQELMQDVQEIRKITNMFIVI